MIVPQVGPAQRHKRGRASINVEVHTAPTLIKALPPQTGEKTAATISFNPEQVGTALIEIKMEVKK